MSDVRIQFFGETRRSLNVLRIHHLMFDDHEPPTEFPTALYLQVT